MCNRASAAKSCPSRDPKAIAEAVLKWADIILQPSYQPKVTIDITPLSFAHFETCFLQQLEKIGITNSPRQVV